MCVKLYAATADETRDHFRGTEIKGGAIWHYDCAQRSENEGMEISEQSRDGSLLMKAIEFRKNGPEEPLHSVRSAFC
jgi:hypothetical protein